MSYDLVIRNGRVFDGTGRPSFKADLGISEGRITTIGRITDHGADDIDAEGHHVTPGFIEGHTHLDAQILWDPESSSPSWHGITTSVMGNCGFTLAPCREVEMDLCLRSLERAEDMSREVMLAGINWAWESYPQYLDAVDRAPKSINVAGYVGHSAVRSYVMGERAFTERATDDDLAAMRREVRSALRAGALGFSTSRLAAHETADDQPVASRVGDWSEVCQLTDVMREEGHGILQLAMDLADDDDQRASFNEAVADLSVHSGRPTAFAWVNPGALPDLGREYMRLSDAASQRGGRIAGQVSSREFLSVLGFRVALPFDRLPGWSAIRGTSLDAQRVALTDPDRRAALVEEAMNGHYGRAIGAEARPPAWDRMRILDSPTGPHRTVAELALERRVTPAEALIDLSLETDFDQLFVQANANREMDRVLELIQHPNTIVGISDSGAHVTQILDTSIPTFLLAYWVREREALSWEAAIRLLTLDPALFYGIADRGLIREGAIADLAVFDPEQVGPGMPLVASDLPATGKRLKQKATGMLASVVAGRRTFAHGEHTGATPGRVIRASSGV
jgi:N-acyl-D-amino-acid deacylase